MDYLNENVEKPPLQNGQFIDLISKFPYVPDPIDRYYGMTMDQLIAQNLKHIQPDQHGKLLIDKEHTLTAFQSKQALEAIERLKDKPFSITLSLHFPHSPIVAAEPYYSMYENLDIPPWPNFNDRMENKPKVQSDYQTYFDIEDYTWDDWERVVKACYGYTTLIDDQVGRIIKNLKELGIYEETAIFFVSDHGGMVGAHGLHDKGPFLYDEILRVPLIARIPGITDEKEGTADNNFVYNYDLMPTFIEVAGGDIDDKKLDAESLIPLINGEKTREPIMIGEFYGHQVPLTQRVVRTENYKYIFNGDGFDELYDLNKDPYELKNLIKCDDYQDIIKNLRQRLLDYMDRNDDLLKRYVVGSRMRE